MRWKQDKKDSETKAMESYDPDAVWNIEGPTRRANDLAKRQRDADWTRRTLESQRSAQKARKEEERANALKEGKQLVAEDLAAKGVENDLVAFKKQLFAQEMMATWQSQNRYKKNMKIVEDEL